MADASLLDLPAQVAMALSLASSSTGTDYHFLVNTAQRESSFRPQARAQTSSAEGLFQFIEETWIRTIKDEGESYGLKEFADKIVKTPAGKYLVPDPKDRVAILNLRRDPRISAMMAGAYARRNAEFIAAEIGRKPTSGELYIAHFLGPSDAVRLIKLRDTVQWQSAPDLFPQAAKANRAIFYADGAPRSVGQVYDLLIRRHRTAGEVRRSTDLDGPSIEGGIDFGTWDAQVEKIYTIRQAGAQFQAAEMSLFDIFSGYPTPAASGADEGADELGGDWGASVSEPSLGTPILDQTGASGEGPLPDLRPSGEEDSQLADASESLAAGQSPQTTGASRLKVIHVAKR